MMSPGACTGQIVGLVDPEPDYLWLLLFDQGFDVE